MKKLLIFLSTAMCFSCSTKHIYKDQIIYKIHNATEVGQPPSYEFQSYTVKKFDGSFKVDDSGLIILKPKQVGDFEATSESPIITATQPDLYSKVTENYFFANVSDLVPDTRKSNFTVAKRLNYFDNNFVLQALSVPIKIRSKLRGDKYGSKFPSTVETGFTGNIAMGWKFAHNSYNPKKNILGLNLNRYSITPGAFLGLGAADLTADNTLDPPIAVKRKALLKSFGGFVILGFTRFGLGYAGGFDYASGDGSKSWVYRGKWWNGFALTLDLTN